MGVLRWGAGLRREELGIAQRLGRSFRAAAVLIALALAVTIATLAAVLGIYQPALVHDVDGRTGARTERQAMADQETALRGYLIAGAPDFLALYAGGQAELARGRSIVDANIGDNTRMEELVAQVRSAEQAWITGWAQPIAAAPPPSGPAEASVLDGDVRLFAAYRSASDALLAELMAHYDATRRNEVLALAAAGALQALLFAVLLFYAAREYRRLARSLVAPFAALLATMRRVGDGDLAARAEVQGPRELRDVAAGFNEMATVLAQERSLRASRETEAMYQATALRDLLDMARNLASNLNLRYVLDATCSHAVSLSGFEQATVWLSEEDRPRLFATVTATAGGTGPAEREGVAVGQGWVGKAARTGRIASGEGGSVADPVEARSVTAVPMIVGARVVGVIELSSRRDLTMPQTAVALVEMLASHAGTAIEAARLHARTEELSQVDDLTRLLNRRRLEGDLDRECKRSRRYDRPLAFCMLDVDHFKRYNDRFGHRRGDEVLEQVGRILRGGIRASDSAYRYGGEEFGLLLRDTTLDAATALCERLRQRVAEHFADGPLITASFGVAVFEPGMQTPADLVEHADRALYRAKSEGRDRVVA